MNIKASLRSAFVSMKGTALQSCLISSVSALETVRQRETTKIKIDSDGDWARRQRGLVLYSPSYPRSISAAHAEVDDIWCFYRSIAPGDVVVDIGAGGGEHVLFLSDRVGRTGRVLAVEAHPGTFRSLQKTIASNRLENVTAMNVAVMARDGETFIETASEYIGNRTGVSSGVHVPSVSLDSLLKQAGLGRVDVLKMNIEGSEREAVEGAVTAFQTVDHWIVSCHDFIVHERGRDMTDDGLRLMTLRPVYSAFERAGLTIRPLRRDERRYWLNFYLYADRRVSSGHAQRATDRPPGKRGRNVVTSQ